ncbi:MAG: glycosyltransferase family 4 protein [Lachnospiraceae bacterium]|nr:glycosyltransferase family 4 protein [Lachnospiraceae bacterium]
MRIIQLLRTLNRGDGVGNEAIELSKLFTRAGIDNHIYACVIGEGIDKSLCSPVSKLGETKDSDILLYHFSIGSSISELVKKKKGRLILRYHNVTPYHFLKNYNPYLALRCMRAMEELKDLIPYTHSAVAVSEFNKKGLMNMGYTCDIRVCPILLDPDVFKKKSESNPRGKDILFVGRIVPNKKQEDIIKAFYVYNRDYDPDSKLILCGNNAGFEKYDRDLKDYVKKLGIKEGKVIFTGKVSEEKLVSFYENAGAFLCMSEHEGFCIPLIEAMHMGIPVVAYDSAAVGETLGMGGIALRDKDPHKCAAILNEVINNTSFREKVVICGKENLKRFEPTLVADNFLDILGLKESL